MIKTWPNPYIRDLRDSVVGLMLLGIQSPCCQCHIEIYYFYFLLLNHSVITQQLYVNDKEGQYWTRHWTFLMLCSVLKNQLVYSELFVDMSIWQDWSLAQVLGPFHSRCCYIKNIYYKMWLHILVLGLKICRSLLI